MTTTATDAVSSSTLGTDSRIRRLWTSILSIGLLALATALGLRGFDFYQLSVGQRPLHDDYRILSAVGDLGLGYGFIGTALIILNLLYLVRRHYPRLPLGSLRVWLEIHVFTGLAGSLLILFHSAFQTRNTLATITSVSLLFVVITGLVGRYLVSLSPGTHHGALEDTLRELDIHIPGVFLSVRDALQEVPFSHFKQTRGLVITLATVPRWMAQGRKRAKVVRETSLSLATNPSKETAAAIKAAAQHARREVRAEAATSVLRVWRRLHRFFAILMLVTVGVHIGVAWYYGYRWIFATS